MLPDLDFPTLHAVTKLASQANTPRKRPPARDIFAVGEDDRLDGCEGETFVPPVCHNNFQQTIYDVKFYPYSDPDDDDDDDDDGPVFALVTAREVCVYRPSLDPKDPVELLRVFRDPQTDASLNSLVWSQNPLTGDPLICFGGAGSGNIKIVDVLNDSFVRSLSGHGGAINDLAISPLSPTILASASADHSIRIWNLDKDVSKQPCAAILASPDAHKQPVLTLAFHAQGRYLLSGGTDTMINLWTVPDLPNQYSGTDKLIRNYFPVFSSTQVHADYVDCLRFHGDLILSHAAYTMVEDRNTANSILLWKIDGFSSAAPPPARPPMAEPGVRTRSAFGGRFQRLLTFDMPNTSPFYMRFSLFDRPGHRPVLVMGNEKSRFSFWDLYALETGWDLEAVSGGGRKSAARGPSVPSSAATGSTPIPGGQAVDDDDDDDEETDDVEDQDDDENDDHDPSVTTTTNDDVRNNANGKADLHRAAGSARRTKAMRAKLDVGDAFRPLPPHHTVTVPKYNFAVRQCGWSADGAWCVAVGDVGIIREEVQGQEER